MHAHTRDEFFGLAQTRLMPAFTPTGFKKVKAPLPLYHKLRDAYDAGLEKLNARDVRSSYSGNLGSRILFCFRLSS